MRDITECRAELDRIDREIARLFEERMQVCADVNACKMKNGLPVRVPEREKQMLERNQSWINDPELKPYYTELLQKIVDISCEYQTALRQKN